MNHYDLTSDEAAVFFEEANELLESLDRDLVGLENSADDEMIHRIFRAIHTLKGAAGSVGHDSMALLAHAAETLLEKVRNHEIGVSTRMANVLFQVVENLRLFLDDVLVDRPGQVDVTGLIEDVNSLMTTTPAVLSVVTADGADVIPGQGLHPMPVMDDASFAVIEDGLNGGLNLLVVYAEADMTGIAPMARLLQMYMHMEQVAQIIVSSPTGEALEEGRGTGTLVVVVMTDLTRTELESDLSNIFEIAVLQVADLSSAPHLLRTQEEQANEVSQPAGKVIAFALPVPQRDEVSAEQSTDRPIEAAAQRGTGTAPAARTVRTSVERLDNLMNLAGELVTDRNRLFQIYEDMSHLLDEDQLTTLNDTITHLSSVTDRIHDEIFKARMQPIEFIFNKFPRFVRQICQELGKDVELIVTGQETEVDRSVIEQIGDPILHLVRNAIDHGIETVADRLAAGKEAQGQISLSAQSEEGNIVVSIADDGHGVDAEKVKRKALSLGLITQEEAAHLSYQEAIELIFAPGLSTATKVSDLSGRGVGMDVVHNNIQRLSGSVVVHSIPGVGTSFELRLPLTLAIIPTLLVEVWDQVFALPLPNVVEIFKLEPESIQYVRGRETAYVRDGILPLVRLANLFERNSALFDDFRDTSEKEKEQGRKTGEYVVLLSYRDTRLGVIVSSLLGKQDVVIKALGYPINKVQGLTGATLLGDGRIGLIVDISALVSMATNAKVIPPHRLVKA